jgi:uncharacterized membrane protein
MNNKWISTAVSFLVLGMSLVALAFGLMLLFYLLLFGAIVGAALFVVAWVRERFFLKKESHSKTGRIIEHKKEESDHDDDSR